MLRTLLLALTFTTSAFGAEISNYRFAVQNNVEGKSIVHQMVVSVDEDASMKVVLNKAVRVNTVFFDTFGEQEVFEKQLNPLVFNHIIHDIIRLANAPIKKTFSDIVCMMMPGPMHSNDHLSVKRNYDRGQKKFWGDLEVIYSPSGCWVSNKTFPEAQIDRNQANQLKSKLKTLALELVGQELL